MGKKYEYTFGSSFEDAYHDCKLVDDSIVDEYSFQKSDKGLVLSYMDKILEALKKQIPMEVKERKILKDKYGHPYTIRGNCPICGSTGLLASNTDYCNACGQKLKWD